MNKYVNAIRFLGVDAINQANSGHPGIVLGAAPMVYTLFSKFLRVDIKNDRFFNRDRFVLSAGHGSMLLYGALHLSGYDVSIEDIKGFRTIGKTPGHPEYGHTKGVETTSGPLGQGISNAVGMAIAEAHLGAKFNRPNFPVVDHYTYVVCGDGDLQEGVALEAISLAGHLKLDKLIVLFDSNDIQLDGPTNMATSLQVRKYFESQGWQYIFVSDGENIDLIEKAIKKGKKNHQQPTLIEIKTIIGRGATQAGSSKVHGSPLGTDERNLLAQKYQWAFKPFELDQDIYDHYEKHVAMRGRKERNKWIRLLKAYQEQYPELYQLLQQYIKGNEVNLQELIDQVDLNKKEATRSISGTVLDYIQKQYPNMIGGSADLTSSTKAKGADGNFDSENRLGRNINYGVREHAMAAINNGIVLHGGLKAFSGAFFVFSDYMKPAIRLSALMRIPSMYVFTHDSIAVGEDGPTHQPIEQLVGLRSIPNLNVIRPADNKEVIAAWQMAYNSKDVPTALILTRQNVGQLQGTTLEGSMKGAYIVSEAEGTLDGILLASGSEVELAIQAQQLLKEAHLNIRVVSMPSMFLFEKQTPAYQKTVLPKGVKILALEMASPMSYYKYTPHVFGIDTFGLSAKDSVVMEHYGFTPENIKNVFQNIK